MKKLVSECLEEILEGVGDKYAERKWGIPDEESQWKRKFHRATSKDKIVYDDDARQIILNPSSFSGVEPSSRGIILKNGDIYMSTYDNLIHINILRILQNLNIILADNEIINYWKMPPKEFFTVQRYKETNILAAGESLGYLAPLDDGWYRRIEGYTRDELVKMTKEFLYAAKKKNPQFKYSYDLIDIKEGPINFI